MQSEKQIAAAQGVLGRGGVYVGAELVKAALEAALSAAEPVAFARMDDDGRLTMFSTNENAGKGMYPMYKMVPLYAAPPAPSVAVKALQMADETFRDLGCHDKYEATTAALAALSAQVQDVAGWRPIETAPHDTNVLLAWTDSTLPCGWKMEAGMASWGWRRDGVSNMSEHGQATHWMPLPAAPAKQEG